MRAEDFSEHKPGRLVGTPQGYLAFAPNPLPPKLDISWRLVKQVSDADRAMSELAGLASMLPNPRLLIGPFIRREAVLSSRIEGTRASLSDLFFFEAANEAPPDASDVEEVAKFERLLRALP